MPLFSRDVLDLAREYELPVIGLSLNQPYDIMYMQDIPVYFATYAGRAGGQNVRSTVRAMFGEIPTIGTLPVDISDENGTILYTMNTGIIQ